jgi:hypothetical protein
MLYLQSWIEDPRLMQVFEKVSCYCQVLFLKLCPSAFTGCENLHGVPFHAAIVVPYPGTGSIMTHLLHSREVRYFSHKRL